MYIYMRNDNQDSAKTLQDEFVFYSSQPAKVAGLKTEGEIVVSLTPWWVKNCLDKFIDELDKGPAYRLFIREEAMAGDSIEFHWYHSQEDLVNLKKFLLKHI